MEKSKMKSIKASIRTKDADTVRVDFRGGTLTPVEFTSIFMAILEDYTVGLLKVNKAEDVFKHFNSVFGIFLSKILPEKERYELSSSHKEFKEAVDATLGRELTEDDKKDNEDVRFSAYLLCRDILTKEVGLSEESADVILNKRLNLAEKLNTPSGSDLNEERKEEK